MHILFFLVATMMITFALILLTIGALSTGTTRHEVYKRESARQGGRMACVAAIVFSYGLTICWMAAFALSAILTFVYFVFTELCASLTSFDENNCLNLSVFRPLVKEFSDAVKNFFF